RIETLLELKFATARSGSESPLKSPTATDSGALPTPKLVAVPKVPSPFPSRIETLLEPLFATARSGSESPLKSPTATELGLRPTGKLVGALKLTGCAEAGAAAASTNTRHRAPTDAGRTLRPGRRRRRNLPGSVAGLIDARLPLPT